MPDEPILPESLRLDDEGRLDEDLQCLSCEYILRGLSPSGECPECGLPIAESISRDWFQFCDAAWVARLRGGAGLVLLGLVLTALPACSWDNRDTWEVLCLVAMACIPRAILAVDVWRLTCPEPGLLVADYEVARKYARWTYLAAIAVSGAAAFLPAMHGSAGRWLQSMLFPLFAIACLIVSDGFGAELARRLPDIRLRRQTRLVVRTLIGLLCYLVVLLMIAPLALPAAQTGTDFMIRVGSQSYAPTPALGIVLLLPVFTMMGFGLWFLVLIGSLWRRLAEATERSTAGEHEATRM